MLPAFVDQNECATGMHQCSCDASLFGTTCDVTCVNVEGSYDCVCAVGYTLDISGVTCISKKTSIGIRLRMTENSCHNSSIPSSTWRVAYPFPDLDECISGTDVCTCNGLPGCTTTCTDSVGGYICGCSAGFKVDTDGLTCIGNNFQISFRINWLKIASLVPLVSFHCYQLIAINSFVVSKLSPLL